MNRNTNEILATRRAYTDLSSLGLIAIRGADAVTFLQGQFTNDARKLGQHRAQYSGICSPKGRLLSNFLLWQHGDTIYLQLPIALQTFLLKRLSMYVLRSKVQLAEVAEQWLRVGVAGEEAAHVVETLTGAAPTEDMSVIENGTATVIRLATDRFQINVPAAEAGEFLAKVDASAESIDLDLWHWLEIRAGIPIIVPATQDQFVPQMVNFDLTHSVDFQKGCYTGQEIVARTQYLGKLKRRMYLVHSDAEMAAGDEIFSPEMEGQASGMVVNAHASPAGGWDALAVVQISSAQSQPLHVKGPEGALLTLGQLPYAVA